MEPIYGTIIAYSAENATITTGNTNSYVRKKSGVVELQLRFKPLVEGTSVKIATLPEGFRPLSRIVGSTQGVWDPQLSKEGIATCIVNTDGTVEINNYISGTTNSDNIVTNKELILRTTYIVS